ncbi:hypothetical protein RF11_02766 [Thelohanellus kitauei]|uniref:Uncharacterized protein n=1 Tax=Thelohanellus kitauei TaxID=669202 RepID=A0A0C2MDW9_THEKT|nr:hypothetical protein RF11_02766 [Thelohanellus kitauei]
MKKSLIPVWFQTKLVPVRKIIEKYNRMASIEKLSKLDIRDDKEKLYARLRSSRDELDTYIRHTKKIFEEKRFVERENAALKVQLANYDEKVLRLERLEQTLRFEFSRLWHLLKDPEFLKSKNVSEYTGIRDSISNILDPETVEKSNSFFDELDHVKQEIIEKQRIINQLDNEIAELNVKKSDALGSLKDLRNSATS